MDQEIKEGRGCGPNKDYIVLDMTHLGAETIMKRLPSVYEIGHNFANVDITKEPIPVVPTIHYQMGGIPTNIHGQVVVPKGGNPNTVVNGLDAVGECACVSVHGAIDWAPTRCSTCWCSAGPRATTSWKQRSRPRPTRNFRPMPRTIRCRALRSSTPARAANTRRTWPTTSARSCSSTSASS